MSDVKITDSPIPASPVLPTLYEGSTRIHFSCHKGIKCWNACCSNIDISLTPYDILRLKRRLGLKSWEFLRQYTVPYEMEKDGIAGVKFRPVENGTACRFMTDEGCSVYEDRPTACRYYPVGQVAMRKQDEYSDYTNYALVQEEHCLGHQAERELTIDTYREEQGLLPYDEADRPWRQLILKKKSSGPAIGAPSLRSRQLFFMGCYDLDRFREFVRSEGFHKAFVLEETELQKLLDDEEALLQFALGFLAQVFFGDKMIDWREEAVQERLRQVKEEEEARRRMEEVEYDPAFDPVDLA